MKLQNKKGIITTILFLLLFRFPEAQLGKIGKLFLMDSAEAGGLALSLTDIGFINGVEVYRLVCSKCDRRACRIGHII